MDVGIEVFALLVLIWLVGNALLVAVALLGPRAQNRRAARAREAQPASVVSLATLRAARVRRRSTQRRPRRSVRSH